MTQRTAHEHLLYMRWAKILTQIEILRQELQATKEALSVLSSQRAQRDLTRGGDVC